MTLIKIDGVKEMNEDVVQTLETLLEEAKTGSAQGILVYVDDGPESRMCTAGKMNDFYALAALSRLEYYINSEMADAEG